MPTSPPRSISPAVRRRPPILAGTACGLLALALLGGGPTSPTHAQPPADTAPSLKVPDCTVEFINHAHVASDQPGVLALVKPREGDRVKKGELVAQLRNGVAKAAFDIAQAEASTDVSVRVAQETKKVADVEFETIDKLFQKGQETEHRRRRLQLVATKEQFNLEYARHQFDVKKLAVEEARERLNEHDILAPFDGVVVRKFKSAGEAVQQTEEVLEIADIRRLKVEGFVDPQWAGTLTRGLPVSVRFRTANPDNSGTTVTLTGELVFVDLSVSPIKKKLRIWAEIDNADELLRPGVTCTMNIQTDAQSLATN